MRPEEGGRGCSRNSADALFRPPRPLSVDFGRAGLAGAQLRLDTSPCGDGFVGAVGVSHADAEGLKAALLQLRSCHYIAQRHFVLDVPPAAAAEGEPELPLRALELRLEALLPARAVKGVERAEGVNLKANHRNHSNQ